MRDTHPPRSAILQLLREGSGRGAHRGTGSRGSTRLRRTGAAAYSASGNAVAGEWNSALRGSRLDFHRRPNTALPGRLGSRPAVHQFPLRFSALRTLCDWLLAGAIWRGAHPIGLGTVSARTLGAHARPGHRIPGAAAASLWHRTWHLHPLGAAAAASRRGVRPTLPRDCSGQVAARPVILSDVRPPSAFSA